MTNAVSAPAPADRRVRGVTPRLAIAAAVILLGAAAFNYRWAYGYALYHGHIAIDGRISGHGADMPSTAVACVNCHDPSPIAASGGRNVAPLTRASLLESHARRGGPPSAYDEPMFCSVIRDGIDPASVMVNRLMPRFRLPDAQCSALWSYVTSR